MKLQVTWNGPNIQPGFFNKRMNISAGRSISSEYSNQIFSWAPGTDQYEVPPACANLTSVHFYISGLAREKFWYGLAEQAAVDSPLCCA